MFNIFQKKKKEKEDSTPGSIFASSSPTSVSPSQGRRDGDKPLKAEEGHGENKDYKLADSIVIHSMPDNFRPAGSGDGQHKNVGLIIMVGGALFLLSVLAALYFFLFRIAPAAPEERPATSADEIKIEEDDVSIFPETPPPSEPTEPPATPPAGEAKEVYSGMRSEILTAADYSDYEMVIRKYGSLNRIAGLEKQKQQVNQLDNERAVEFLGLIKQAMPRDEDIMNIEEIVSGQTAQIQISVKDEVGPLVSEMVFENNKWRVLNEGGFPLKIAGETVTLAGWLETALKELAIPDSFTFGADSDGDGLTDAEEALLGSQSDNQDSDADTYNDLSEVINLYDPASAGQLIDSASIKEYRNGVYGYNLFYPVGWTENRVGGDDSIMFKAEDNQFVQVIVQPNSTRQSIESWFGEQFDESIVAEAVVGENWQGIKSDDGLIVYLTDNGLNNIYVISYNTGQSDVLEYINIFNMMVKSFSVRAATGSEEPIDGFEEFIEEEFFE